MAEAYWDGLRAELDEWAEAGRGADLWWRDDDAAAATPEFRTLIRLARDHGIPLAVAAVPAQACPALVRAAGEDGHIAFLQHGYAHQNHAPPDEKKMELGPHRRAEMVIAEIAAGKEALERLAHARALPVLVPPWNRIAPGFVPMLPELGFRGLSGFGPRIRAEPARGLRQVNCHADIIDWKGSRGFVGTEAALGQLVGHLRARRTKGHDAGEATGLLTHHAVHDKACWHFIETLFEATRSHPAVRWLDAAAVFDPVGGR